MSVGGKIWKGEEKKIVLQNVEKQKVELQNVELQNVECYKR